MKIYETILDENGKVSSTRTILMTSTLILAACAGCEMIIGTSLSQGLYDILKTILGTGLVSTGARSSIKNWKSQD